MNSLLEHERFRDAAIGASVKPQLIALNSDLSHFSETGQFLLTENRALFEDLRTKGHQFIPPVLSREIEAFLQSLKTRFGSSEFPYADLKALLLDHSRSKTKKTVRAFKVILARAMHLRAGDKAMAWEGFSKIIIKFGAPVGPWQSLGYVSTDHSFVFYGKTHFLVTQRYTQLKSRLRNRVRLIG
jgi:hypothetical protein